MKLISAFVFATWIEQFLYFLNTNFLASSHLQCLYNSKLSRTCSKTTLTWLISAELLRSEKEENLLLSHCRSTQKLLTIPYISNLNINPCVCLYKPNELRVIAVNLNPWQTQTLQVVNMYQKLRHFAVLDLPGSRKLGAH